MALDIALWWSTFEDVRDYFKKRMYIVSQAWFRRGSTLDKSSVLRLQ